ncbi:hypothetical protein [Pseudomonas sp. AF32]|uniref:hypothetical protein n=1 Tax=Pseudomonas sp. AF32 TaxID=554390 RepID=UPI001EED57E3|nr:hypothetical protein [Pseudomonas sp. AF32]
MAICISDKPFTQMEQSQAELHLHHRHRLPPASPLIDTQAPLDVLHLAADYRIRTVTQVLENIAFCSEIASDTVLLSNWGIRIAPTASQSDTISSMFDEKTHDLQSISHLSKVAIWLQMRL